MTSGLDFTTSQQVFRKDRRMVLAMNRHQAAIIGVRLAYDAAGYLAGQTMARNSVSGLYQKYAPAGSSGIDTAVGILFNDVLDMPASQTDLGQLIVKGQVFEANCLTLDSAAKVDLGARSVIDGSGVTIMMF
jgi:YD repeat-containing protein